jgi:predicted transcriptional regulator
MMRSTVRLDDDLLQALKKRAELEQTSMTKLLNRAVREWFAGGGKAAEVKKQAFVQETFSMGKPLVDLTKALQLAAQLEDEYVIEKMRHGK